MGAVVYLKLLFARKHGFFCDDRDLRFVSADANGEIGGTGTALRSLLIALLYASVLKGVEGKYRYSAALVHALDGAFYNGRDNGKLGVYLYAYRLKTFFGGMSLEYLFHG